MSEKESQKDYHTSYRINSSVGDKSNLPSRQPLIISFVLVFFAQFSFLLYSLIPYLSKIGKVPKKTVNLSILFNDRVWLIVGTFSIFIGVTGFIVATMKHYKNPTATVSEKYFSLLFALLGGVFLINGFSFIYATADFLKGAGENEVVLNAIYFSIVTWTTLGYGDIQPTGTYKLIAATQALLGYVYMALISAKMISILQYSGEKSAP